MITVVKFLFRILGYGFLAVAIIAGIADASSSIALSQLHLAPMGQVWMDLSPLSFEAAGVFLTDHVHPLLWGTLQQSVMTWPVWAVFAPLGLLLLWLGAKRRRQQAQFA
ncbi:hypothetical protein [Roseibium sp. M-1]